MDSGSRHAGVGSKRLGVAGLSCLTLVVGGAALGVSAAGAADSPSTDADALATESPSALAQVLPATSTPDLGTHGTINLQPDPGVSAGPAAAQPSPALQPVVPCNVGLIAYNSGGRLARTAFAKGSITCLGADVIARITPTFDWFDTPLFNPFRHAPRSTMSRPFGVPYFVGDTTTKGVVRHRVVRLCVLVSAPGYLPAFGCFYAPFGPFDPLQTGGV
jgi:hypothetical protein